MKLLKIIKWIVTNTDLMAFLWQIYEAAKDGKITKKELRKLTKQLPTLIGQVIE